MASAARSTPEVSFRVDLATNNATLMKEVSLASIGIKERTDLQRWIEEHPEIVESDLLIVTTEFDQWELKEKKVADRLDALFLDSDGALLVAELKRDEAPDTTELQALKYAAYCSQLTVPDVIDQYSRYHEVDAEAAREAILDHAPALAERELGDIRVRIVAGSFGPSVTHVVLWLGELGLDIGCNQVTAREHGDGHAVVSSRQLLPPPAAEDYLVKKRRREAEEEEREASSRRRNSVTVLTETDALSTDEPVTLNLNAFSEDQRPVVEAKIAENADYANAEWTGQGIRHALRWRADGQTYSCSGLVWKMLDGLGFEPGSLPGPDYWLTSAGKTLYETAVEIEARPPEAEQGKSSADYGGPAVPETVGL